MKSFFRPQKIKWSTQRQAYYTVDVINSRPIALFGEHCIGRLLMYVEMGPFNASLSVHVYVHNVTKIYEVHDVQPSVRVLFLVLQ
jgi:hypothetical protein